MTTTLTEEEEVQNINADTAEASAPETSPKNNIAAVNEEVETSDKPLPPFVADPVPTSTSAGRENGTRNTTGMTVTTASPLSSPASSEFTPSTSQQPSPPPQQEEPVHYVDERSKAMDRKAELEALRSRNEITKKKAAFDADSPMSNSTLASFFLQQKQMKNTVRQHRLGALHSLNQFRLKECTGMVTPRRKYHHSYYQSSATAPFATTSTASSSITTTLADDFFRKQQQFDAEWRRNKEAAFRKLHMYRQQNVHDENADDSHGGKEDSPTKSSIDTTIINNTNQDVCPESVSTNNDTEIFNSLLLVHAELMHFFTSIPAEASDPTLELDNGKSNSTNGLDRKATSDPDSPVIIESRPKDGTSNSKLTFGTLGLDQVLDPFTGTRPSFEEAQKEELAASIEASPKKSCPLINHNMEDNIPSTLVEGGNNLQVMMMQHVVDNIPTEEAATDLPLPEKDDSTVSSIGSSLDGSVDRNSLQGGQSSSSSLSTFWKEDAPPSEEPFSALLLCDSEQYIPNLHSTRGHCERCFSLASDAERAKFLDEGRHVRIMIVRGGCTRDCNAFPRGADEPPVRLCRKCYFDTHRPPRKSTDGRDLFHKHNMTSPKR